MDISLAKTFLAVLETGSFVNAAASLNLTQTAVSARIRVLEDRLGRKLFVRNKSGARLTQAGGRFVKHAVHLVQAWERARHQVGLPEGCTDIATLGAELSLWHPVLSGCMIWMAKQMPEMALRAEVRPQGELLEAVRSGSMDMAVLYDPPQSNDLVVELLEDERLVMVSTAEEAALLPQKYVHVDWGPAFGTYQALSGPVPVIPSVSFSHGPLALQYMLSIGGTGYFRWSAVRERLASRELRKVPEAPEFAYSAHLVYSTEGDTALIESLRHAFRASSRPDNGAGGSND